MNGELQRLLEIVERRDGCDVVIDFSSVDIVTSASFSILIRLQRRLTDNGRRLILCGIRSLTKGVFEVTGLDDVFEVCEHIADAMLRLQTDRSP